MKQRLSRGGSNDAAQFTGEIARLLVVAQANGARRLMREINHAQGFHTAGHESFFGW